MVPFWGHVKTPPGSPEASVGVARGLPLGLWFARCDLVLDEFKQLGVRCFELFEFRFHLAQFQQFPFAFAGFRQVLLKRRVHW